MKESTLIERYLKNEDTTYAILINGRWGSGKTYYWKNFLVPELISRTAIPPFKDYRKYKALYVSLYGIDTIGELGRKILYEMIPFSHKDNKIVRAVSTLGAKTIAAISNVYSIGEIKIGERDIVNISNLKSYVVAFDDLERISSTELLEKVLGFINYLSEHEGVKVLLFMDEEKLKTQLGKWSQIKEKIVSEEIHFNPDYESIIKQIVGQLGSKSAFGRFANEKLDTVVKAFIRSGTLNLRSLKYGLERFKYLFEESQSDKELAPLYEHILFSCLCISFEFKAGNITKDDDKGIKYTSVSLLEEKAIVQLRSIANKKGAVSYEKLDKFSEDFIHKYFDKQLKYVITDSLYDYIVTGIGADSMTAEIVEKYKPLDMTTTFVDQLNAIQRISVEPLSDDKFEKLLNNVLESTIEGRFELMYYPIIYRRLLILRKRNLIKKTEEEIDDLVERGLQSYRDRGNFTYVPMISAHLDIAHFGSYGDRLTAFRNKVIQLNKEAREELEYRKINDAIRLFSEKGESQNLLEIYCPTSGYPEFDLFFKHVNLTEFVKVVVQADHATLFQLSERTSRRYKRGWFDEEFVFLDEFRCLLEEKLPDVESPLRRYYLTKLVNATKRDSSTGGPLDEEDEAEF